jgi:catechol 2,3-dioxygenase-like lactoylglutathione lyase family enzyme
MKFSGLSHLAFGVRDLDDSLHFYCEQLGMHEAFRLTFGELLDWKDAEARAGRPQPDDPATLAYMQTHRADPWLLYIEAAPGQYIELFPAMDPSLLQHPQTADSHAHLCLLVDDAEQAAAELRNQGLQDEGPITMGPDDSLQFWLTDPDGHRIEVMQYTAHSVQRANAQAADPRGASE